MIFTLYFADDQVILAEDDIEVHYMLRKLIDAYNESNQTINTIKTDCIKIAGKWQDLELEN